MPNRRTPDPTPQAHEPQLGNPEPGMAHWPVDLELHPETEKPAPAKPGKATPEVRKDRKH